MKPINSLKKVILILTASFLLILASQTQISAQSNGSSASNSQTIVNADDLADCTQMLDKALDALKACKDRADKAVNYAAELFTENLINEKLLAYYKTMAADLEKRVKYLEGIKCSEFRFLFIFKYKRCK